MRALAELILMELSDLDRRVRVQEVRLPGDPDVVALKREIAQHRADVVELLARLREVDPAELSPETLH